MLSFIKSVLALQLSDGSLGKTEVRLLVFNTITDESQNGTLVGLYVSDHVKRFSKIYLNRVSPSYWPSPSDLSQVRAARMC